MSVYQTKNFIPYANYTVSASAVSANQAVTQPTYGAVANDLLISNSTSAVAFLTWGTSAQTATTGGFAVMPGAIMTVNMGQTPITNIGVILGSATTGSVYLSIGQGS